MEKQSRRLEIILLANKLVEELSKAEKETIKEWAERLANDLSKLKD